MTIVAVMAAAALLAGCGGDDDAAVPEQAPGIAAPTAPLTTTTPQYEAEANAAEGALAVEADLRQAFLDEGARKLPDEAISDTEIFLAAGTAECSIDVFTYGADEVAFLRAGYSDSSQGVVTNQAGDLGVVVTSPPDDKPACLRAAGPVIEYLVVGQAGLQREPNAPPA